MEYYNKIISALNIIVESDQTEFYITEKEIKWAENFFIDNNDSSNNVQNIRTNNTRKIIANTNKKFLSGFSVFSAVIIVQSLNETIIF